MTKKITLSTILFLLFSVFNISADNDTDDNEMDGDARLLNPTKCCFSLFKPSIFHFLIQKNFGMTEIMINLQSK